MELTGNTFFFEWEVRLMEWMQAQLGPVGIAIATFFTEMGDEVGLIVILGFIYWVYNKSLGVKLGARLILAATWNPMLKNIALRRRPYFDNPSIRCIRASDPTSNIYDINAQEFSFPSLHASMGASLYLPLAKFTKKKWLKVSFVLVMLLIGVSRPCLGVHYPTDILCGWLLGLIILGLCAMLEKYVRKEWLRYLLIVLTAIPGFFFCKSNDFFTGFGTLIGFFQGTMYEKKYVNFENTQDIPFMVLRTVCGFLIYLVLNEVLKLPFSTEFLTCGSFWSHVVRSARYVIVMFTLIGLYPRLFKVVESKFAAK